MRNKKRSREQREQQNEESRAHVLGPIQSRGRLDGETQKYFLELLPLLEEATDAEDRITLCSNALEEARGKELQLACHPSCSRVLEKLIESSELQHVVLFLEQSRDGFGTIAMDPAGSHVLEAALNYLGAELQKQPEKKLLKTIKKTLAALCEVLKANALPLMTSKYGSHVLRNFLFLLSGKAFGDDDKNALSKKLARTNAPREKYTQVHEGFPSLLKSVTTDILEVSKASVCELRVDSSANPALQTILKTLVGDEDAVTEAISILLALGDDVKENSAAVEDVRQMMENNSGSHLMEVILEEAPDALYTELLQQFFRRKLHSLAVHHIANFVVQALIKTARQQAQVNLIVDELIPCFADLIENRRGGVLASLMAACGRFDTRQSEVCKALVAAIKTANPITGLLRLESYTSGAQNTSKMSVIGCAILQTMFTFRENCVRKYLASFADIDSGDVLLAAKDRAGCHVLEAFLASPASYPLKLKVIGKLQGYFAELALHPGSHYLVNKSYDAADLKLKEALVSELVPIQKELSKTKQGPYMLGKLNVARYATAPEAWKSTQNAKQATKAAFEEMLGGKSKKRRRKA